MSGDKSKQAIRAEQVAVASDAMEQKGEFYWLKPGAWVSVVMADPIYFGQIVQITPSHYFLKEASWVADTGRMHQYAEDPSTRSESEYIGDIAIERPAVAIYHHPKAKSKLETK